MSRNSVIPNSVPPEASEHVAALSNLTRSQQLFWLGQKLNPEASMYNMALAVFIDGAIDPVRFRTAFRQLVMESDSLRTTFNDEDGVPQQHVNAELQFDVELIGFADAPSAQDQLRDLLTQRSSLPFNLAVRLFSTALIKLGDTRFVWYINVHHLITDASSMALMHNRLQEIYAEADESIEPSPIHAFSDYVTYETAFRDSPQYRKSVDYWNQKGDEAATPIAFYGKTSSATTSRSIRIERRIGKERTLALSELAALKEVRSLTFGLSMFNVFATLLFAWLYRISGNRSLSIGTPSHNRATAAFRKTVGPFIEMFPLGITINEGETFLSLLNKVSLETRGFVLNARPGTSAPARNRAFEVVLNYFDARFSDFDGLSTHTEWIHPGHADPSHAMRLQIFDFDQSGDFVFGFDLNEDVFSEQQREAVAEHFFNVVDGLLADRNQSIDTPKIISAGEQHQWEDFNSTQRELADDLTVIRLFEAQAKAFPDRIALSCGDETTTYRSLNEQSDQLADELRKRGVSSGTIVGICLKRSPHAVVAMLSVLKSGAAYVPIDPSSPNNRIAGILADSCAKVVLSQSTLADRIPATIDVICLDGVDPKNAVNAMTSVPSEKATANADNPAYVIYTSGSTGQPKGVVIQHRALVNYIHWAKKQYVGNQTLAMPLFTPLSFDLTITSIYVPLVSGGRIEIYPESDEPADLAVLDVLDDNRVDIIKLTPAHLALLQDRDLSNSRITQLVLGGEDLRSELARSISQRFGGKAQIHNEYGPTEATVGCILHTFDPQEDWAPSVPIGRPVDNMQAYILNGQLQQVTNGVVGQLYVAGRGLASGYLQRPDLTADRFIDNPFRPGTTMYRTGDLARINSTGQMECLGRDDHQVKIRGARIELGEIEAAISELSSIESCIVLAAEKERPAAQEITHYCVRCGLPSNYPDAKFSLDGVCDTCTTYDTYKARAELYFRTLDDLREVFAEAKTRNKSEYDCLALLSGGKDSTYVLCQLVDMGFKVLAFTLDNGYISDQAKGNIDRVIATLGVDHMYGSTPAMDAIFADSLRRHANVCQGCFKTVYTLSFQEARKRDIPIIVTGLSRGQLFETRLTREFFTSDEFNADSIDKTILDARKAYHRMDDAVSQHLDTRVFADDKVFKETQFIDFFRYSNVELDEMLACLDERVPWIRPSDTGRSTNCLINDAGIYVHKRMKGFHNYALPYSWDVRMGHKTRDAALAELNDEINVPQVHTMLREVGFDDVAAANDKRLVAYYTSSHAMTGGELRQRLKNRLPGFMIPSLFVRLDEIPLTPNGKVDRQALPKPDSIRPVSDDSYMAPQTDNEQALVSIWAEVLGVDRVGIRDNFFDLGGDSISAIQVVARANRIGLSLIPGQLFNTLTIEKLAVLSGTKSSAMPQQGPITGTVTLSPVQRWFFEQTHANQNHWNHVVRLNMSADVNESILEESLQAVIKHHEALRLKFINEDHDWSSMLDDTPVSLKMNVHQFAGLQQEQVDSRVNEIEAELQTEPDITQGQLCAAALFISDNRPAMMTLVVHHLAVDTISWSILLEDLATAYQQRLSGEPVNLPGRTTSFQQWTEALRDHSRSDSLRGEVKFWRDSLQTAVPNLPVDRNPTAVNTEDASGSLSTQLNAQQTRSLLNEVPGVYRITVHEVLAAALAVTLQQWTRSRNVRFNLEGHGREAISSQLDISRTVGWFTSIYPATITLPEDTDLASILAAVKNQLRSIPKRGIGYGILRHLSPDAEVRQSLASESSEVLFNYLGRTDGAVSSPSVFEQHGQLELSRSPQTVRPHLLEINAMVSNDRLVIDWKFCGELHVEETIRNVANNFITNLKSLISHCLSAGKLEGSASDFPLAKLNEEKLRKLSGLLLKAGKGGKSNHES